MVENRNQRKITIELTVEQQEQIKLATGRDVPALELSAEELEERIAPGVTFGRDGR